ncbi:hypothetical protein Acsp05_22050 [Actinokineospora sp. NBRC 105648]|nr:hypothetical protein Acsp05_22050 [Actinokineospora sp. NBRC 105648]
MLVRGCRLRCPGFGLVGFAALGCPGYKRGLALGVLGEVPSSLPGLEAGLDLVNSLRVGPLEHRGGKEGRVKGIPTTGQV